MELVWFCTPLQRKRFFLDKENGDLRFASELSDRCFARGKKRFLMVGLK